MPRLLLVLMLALGVLPGPAPAAPGTAAAPSVTAYASELDAAIAASAAVNARSIREDREFLGAVLRRGADFHYSLVPGHAGADRIRARLAVPDGFELVALWHTHGGPAPERRYFSIVDAELVARTGKPLYLADYTGALRVLQPGAPRLSAIAARQLGLPGRSGYARGEQLRHLDGELVHIPTRPEPALAMAVSN
ncbi:MAG: DUF4329 domain-containing protein [Gammaproteobacteria bacterium]